MRDNPMFSVQKEKAGEKMTDTDGGTYHALHCALLNPPWKMSIYLIEIFCL